MLKKACIFQAPVAALDVLDEYVDLCREVGDLSITELSRQRLLERMLEAYAEELRGKVALLRERATALRAAAKQRGEVVPNREGLGKDRVEAALRASAADVAAGGKGKPYAQIAREEGVTDAYVSRIAVKLGIRGRRGRMNHDDGSD